MSGCNEIDTLSYALYSIDYISYIYTIYYLCVCEGQRKSVRPYVSLWDSVSVCECLSKCACICVCLCQSVRVCVWGCMSKCTRVYLIVCVCVCVCECVCYCVSKCAAQMYLPLMHAPTPPSILYISLSPEEVRVRSTAIALMQSGLGWSCCMLIKLNPTQTHTMLPYGSVPPPPDSKSLSNFLVSSCLFLDLFSASHSMSKLFIFVAWCLHFSLYCPYFLIYVYILYIPIYI